MFLGRVVGRVWSTVKNPGLEGQRFLIVQPIGEDGKVSGRRVICCDWTGAGSGETVYWVRGKEASMSFLPAEVPTDLCIVGIVDSIHIAKKRSRRADRARSGRAHGHAEAP